MSRKSARIQSRLAEPDKGIRITIRRRRNDPFARVPKALLDDTALTWGAKGVLAYLLGKPDDWKPQLTDLERRGRNGRDGVRSIIREIRAAGYGRLHRYTDERGRVVEWHLEVADCPAFRPEAAFPHLENPPLTKNEGTEKERAIEPEPLHPTWCYCLECRKR